MRCAIPANQGLSLFQPVLTRTAALRRLTPRPLLQLRHMRRMLEADATVTFRGSVSGRCDNANLLVTWYLRDAVACESQCRGGWHHEL